jgi:hypothetical protein
MNAHLPPRPSTARRRRRAPLLAAGAVLLAGAATLAVTGVADASTSAPASVCSDGPWHVAGASVEGRPVDFEHGDPGRTYLWHDGTGWHLRTTDTVPVAHHYTGSVGASPGAAFADVDKVRLDPGDRLWVDHGTLHYDFTTYSGIDGIDFRVTACDAARTSEQLTFTLRKGGAADPGLVDLGAGRAHPGSDPFTASR